MTDIQFIWIIIAVLASGATIGFMVEQVVRKLSAINSQLEILIEITDRLENVRRAIEKQRKA